MSSSIFILRGGALGASRVSLFPSPIPPPCNVDRLAPASSLHMCMCETVRVAVFYGGVPIKQNIDVLNGDQKPHIIVCTPGRVLELVRSWYQIVHVHVDVARSTTDPTDRTGMTDQLQPIHAPRTGAQEGAEAGPREALRAGRVRQAPRAARCVARHPTHWMDPISPTPPTTPEHSLHSSAHTKTSPSPLTKPLPSPALQQTCGGTSRRSSAPRPTRSRS